MLSQRKGGGRWRRSAYPASAHRSRRCTARVELLERRELLSSAPMSADNLQTLSGSVEPLFEVMARAEPDEWYTGIGQPYVPYGEQQPGDPGKPKINQSYVWGMTESQGALWLGTGANVASLGHGVGGQGASETLLAVTELGESQYPLVPESLRDYLGDWRPPRFYRYDLASGQLQEKTPDDSLINSTLGIRSAGANDEIVLLAGPDLTFMGMNVFAFDAATGEYLGSQHILRYTDVRSWVNYNGQLYVGTVKTFSTTGEGAILRWTGTRQNPFQYTEVGRLDLEAANLAVHDGRLYASTWPLWAGSLMGLMGYRSDAVAGLWMSPPLGTSGLDRWDAGNWTKVWSIDEYEPDPIVARSLGGGALQSFDGYLYWGTMQVTGTGAAMFMEAYPDEPVSDFMTLLKNTTRATPMFRGRNFDEPANREVELLFGDPELPCFVPSGVTGQPGSWIPQPNKTGTATFGRAGFGTGTNYYTWSMDIYENQLYVGTCDYSPTRFTDLYLSTSGNVQLMSQMLGGIMLGADLWIFPTRNQTPYAATTYGGSNPNNYGFRNVEATDYGLFLGTANGSNLLTDPSSPLGLGGWELIRMLDVSSNPEITMVGILNGDTTPSEAEGTDFGTVLQGQSGPTRTYTVRNDGSATLTLGSVTLPTGYALTESLVASLEPGQSDTFTVRLDTASTGTKSGEISFTTNDKDDNPFRFSVTGKVSSPVGFFDNFAQTTINAALWATVSRATIDSVGLNEPSASYSLRLNGTDSIASKVIDLSGQSQAKLSYYYQRTGGGDSTENGDNLILEYWSGSAWVELQRQLGSGADMTNYVQSEVLLPAGALHAGFRFRLRTTGSTLLGRGYDDWFVDDVKLTASAAGGTNPLVLAMASNDAPAATSAQDPQTPALATQRIETTASTQGRQSLRSDTTASQPRGQVYQTTTDWLQTQLDLDSLLWGRARKRRVRG